MAQSVKHLVRQKYVEKRLFKKNLLNQSQNTRFYVGAPQIKGKFTMDNEWFQLFKRSIFFFGKVSICFVSGSSIMIQLFALNVCFKKIHRA